MLHQRDRVSALRFALSDPVIETHLGLSVPYHEGLLKMNLIGEICDLGNVQQRKVMGRHGSDRFALKQIEDQTAGDYFSLVEIGAEQHFIGKPVRTARGRKTTLPALAQRTLNRNEAIPVTHRCPTLNSAMEALRILALAGNRALLLIL
jgi:hypothetical protein